MVFMQTSTINERSCLLASKKFYPLFWLQFLGAFNDNLFKNALVMLITFKLTETSNDTGLLITLAAGLFILPFFLFSSFAGQLADRYSKPLLIRKIKLAEILIMLLGALGLMNQDLFLLFITLFLMGAQSAFFGPIKYSILPEILPDNQLIKGNGLFSGSTFIAILLGTIFGGIGVLLENGTVIMAVVVLVVAIVGYGLSLLVKNESIIREIADTIDWNLFRSTLQIVRESKTHDVAFFSVLSISWFWFIGAVLLSQIPALVKYDLQADDNVVIVFLTLFSVGIALGSGLVSLWMRSSAHLKWHWVLLVGMSLMLIATIWAIYSTNFNDLAQDVSHETLLTFSQFLVLWPASLSLLFLLILAILGGMYIVPLYTLLQTQTPQPVRARMVAVNNIVNALFMVLSAILLMVGFALSLSLLDMLIWLAVINLLMVLVLYRRRNR